MSRYSSLTRTLVCWYAPIVICISKISCISQNFLHPGKQPEELFTEADGNAARSTGKEETSELGGRAFSVACVLGKTLKWASKPSFFSSSHLKPLLSLWLTVRQAQPIVIQQIVSKAILTPWTESEARWSLVVVTFFNLWLSRLVNECVRVAEELPLSNLWPHLLFK